MARTTGPSCFAAQGDVALLGRPTIVRVDQGVSVAVGPGVIDLVEHAAAAVGGLGLHRGVELRVDGGEVPLLDGGAARVVAALGSLGVAPSAPRLCIVRRWHFAVGDSLYEIEPGGSVDLSCDIEFTHRLIGRQRATFHGDAADFVARLAPARTFGFLRDHAALSSRGRARGVDLSAVVVFGDDALVPGCELASADEPVRHKLLDLVGDLALFGGPALGRLSATRPGHAATHAFVRAALASGAMALTE